MSRSDYDDYARELRDERNDRFGDELQHAGAEHGKPQPLSVAPAPRPRQPESVEGMVDQNSGGKS